MCTEMHQRLAQLQARVSIPGILKTVEDAKRFFFWVVLGLRLSMNWVTDDQATQRSLYEAYQVIMAIRINLVTTLLLRYGVLPLFPMPAPPPCQLRPHSIPTPSQLRRIGSRSSLWSAIPSQTHRSQTNPFHLIPSHPIPPIPSPPHYIPSDPIPSHLFTPKKDIKLYAESSQTVLGTSIVLNDRYQTICMYPERYQTICMFGWTKRSVC